MTALEEGKVKTVTLQPVQLVLEVKGEMEGYEEGEDIRNEYSADNEALHE